MSLDRLIELAREASGEENPDVYRYLASESLGVPYSEVTKDQRTDAKRRFYHFLYTDYNSEGGLPAPVAQPSLEEVATLVARFKAAFPELEQPLLVATPTRRSVAWRPELQDLPNPNRKVLVIGMHPFVLGRVLGLAVVPQDDRMSLEELALMDSIGHGYGPALESFDFESLEKAYEYMHQYAGREKVSSEPVPSTKMKSQAREPYWSKSWKGRRKR